MIMGRGRGKGKKRCAIAIGSRDHTEIDEDEKLPVKRRGRPLKAIRDDINEEDEVEKIEEDDGEDEDDDGEETKSSVLSESNMAQAVDVNGRKRKMPPKIKESDDSVTEENGTPANADPMVLIKIVNFRKPGSRRKSKNPCRAPDR